MKTPNDVSILNGLMKHLISAKPDETSWTQSELPAHVFTAVADLYISVVEQFDEEELNAISLHTLISACAEYIGGIANTMKPFDEREWDKTLNRLVNYLR